MGGLFMDKEKREQIKIIEDALWCPTYVDKVVKSGEETLFHTTSYVTINDKKYSNHICIGLYSDMESVKFVYLYEIENSADVRDKLMEIVNSFNSSQGFSNCYIDYKGNIIVEYDLIVLGDKEDKANIICRVYPYFANAIRALIPDLLKVTGKI